MSKSRKIYIFIKILLISLVTYIFFESVPSQPKPPSLKTYTTSIVSVISLFIFILPNIVGKIFKVKFPMLLDIVICIFTFFAQILGDIYNFYLIIPWWDDFLHFTSGMMFIEIGYFFIDLIKINNSKICLSPLFMVAISFYFTITVLTFWECIEFGCDKFLGTDTQKDTIVTEINSSEFTRKNKGTDKYIKIDTLIVNNQDWNEKYGGYLDIGLHDTMYDLLNGIIGAFFYSIVRYYNTKNKNMKMEVL